ncbi:PST family polysaccharide transporter [Geodermatophilus normandii]|uniref:PST family polysaccharide transporter n=2 Tax=Geodermatophilus normandii TaxID=1137989 RepID=A0A317QES9_9ACTN|nr:PST family polysaccharide transporter [Geodermatophilus normandii]
MAVVVRLVTPREFGVFAVAFTVHAVVTSMSELGVVSVLQRGDTDPDKLAPTVATVSLVSAATVATGMYLLAAPLATALGADEAAPAIRVMALAVLMVGVFAVPGAMLARDFQQNRIFRANLVAFVPSSALLLVLASAGEGALAFAWSRVLGQLVVGVVMALSADKRYGFGFDRGVLRFVLGVGLPLAGANLVGYTLLNIDYAFIGRLLGPVELGVYVLAFNVANWSMSLLNAMINGVAVPMFSRLRHDPAALARALWRAHQAVAVIGWPIAALSAASAGPLIETVYGRTWIAAAPVLAVLAPYGVLAVHALLYSNVLVGGAAHARMLLYVQLIWLATLIPAMWLGVQWEGVMGAAVAHVVVIVLVVAPTYLIAVRRMSGVSSSGVIRTVVPIACAAVLAAGADWLVAEQLTSPWSRLLSGLAVGCMVYLLLVARLAQTVLPDSENGTLGRLSTGLRRILELADLPRSALMHSVVRRNSNKQQPHLSNSEG